MTTRICLGRFLSLDALFSAISCTLHTFNVSPAHTQQHDLGSAELKMQPGMIRYVNDSPLKIVLLNLTRMASHPETFHCSIVVRCSATEVLLTE